MKDRIQQRIITLMKQRGSAHIRHILPVSAVLELAISAIDKLVKVFNVDLTI